MQVTIDIPEPRYGELAREAQTLQTTVEGLLSSKLQLSTAPAKQPGTYVRFPLISTSRTDSVDAVDEDALDFLDPA